MPKRTGKKEALVRLFFAGLEDQQGWN